MEIHSKVVTRIIFGSLLTLVFASLLIAEGWLATHDYYCLSPSLRGLPFALIASLLAALACYELHHLATAKGLKTSLIFMIFAVFFTILSPFFAGFYVFFAGFASLPAVLLALIFLAAMTYACRCGTAGTIAHLSVISFSTIYLGLGMWFLLALRLLNAQTPTIWSQSGPILMFLATVKSADIGAYFTGRRFGKHKWVPSISPGKTWEGLAGGILLAIIVSSLFSAFSGIISIVDGIVFGFVVSVSGQLGDLMESMLKRDAGSKDSAHLVPEFGGVLDALDSVLIAAPFGFMILTMTR
jgi:phosphatidate cytidylyltransferase